MATICMELVDSTREVEACLVSPTIKTGKPLSPDKSSLQCRSCGLYFTNLDKLRLHVNGDRFHRKRVDLRQKENREVRLNGSAEETKRP
jgi:hypothetical protein